MSPAGQVTADLPADTGSCRPAPSATMHSMLRAVIFDFDGTILDTEEPEYRAWAELFETHGSELTVEEWAICIGTSGAFDPLATLLERAPGPLPTVAEIEQVRRLRNRELLGRVELREGVLRWLDDAAAHRLAVGIASSSEVPWVEEHLTRLGLLDRFGCLSCRSEVIPAKPDPASYRAACERLGVAPADAVAVEDSPHGVAAAVAAGLFTVAVPHDLTRHLDLAAADVVVDSLADLPLARVIELHRERAVA